MRKAAASRAIARAETRDRINLRMWLISFAFLTLAALLASSVNAQSFKFSNISVDGNVRVEYGTILARAGLKQNATYSAAQINDAYQKLSDTGLFESIEFSPSGNTLNISVVERPPINRIAFEGNSRINNSEIAALVHSEQGRVFNP